MDWNNYPFFKNRKLNKTQEKLFNEFLETRLLSEESGSKAFTYLNTFKGRIEESLFIQIKSNCSFSLFLDRSEWISENLNELELSLFWWAYDEGYLKNVQ